MMDNETPKKELNKKAGVFHKYKRFIPFIILVIFTIVYLVQAVSFIQQDTLIQYTDHHSFISGKYHHFFSNPREVNFPRDWYPPVMYFITHVFYLARRGSIETARLSVLFFMPIFIFSIYGIGKKYGGDIAGLTAAVLAASSPFILNTSRNYFPDFPQTAMTALCFYLLLQTDGFRKTGMSCLLGLVLALAFLTKWSTPFFIILPLAWFIFPHIFKNYKSGITFFGSIAFYLFIFSKLLEYKELSGPGIDQKLWLYYYVVYIAFPIIGFLLLLELALTLWRRANKRISTAKEAPEEKAEFKAESAKELKDNTVKPKDKNDGWINVINFSRMSLITLLLISPWLVYSAMDIRYKFFFEHQTGDRAIGFNDFVLKYILMMFKTHFNLSLILILTGIVFLFIKRDKLYEKLILPVNIIFCIALMSYIGHTDARYSLSIIIFSAVLGTWWIQYGGKLQHYISGFLVTLSFLSVFAWSIFPPGSPLVYRISRDRMSIIHKSQAKKEGFPLRILSGGLPHKLSGIDFTFIPREIKNKNKSYMKLKVFDKIDIPRFSYPPPSLNDMLIDAALKYDLKPGPVGDLGGSLREHNKIVILYKTGDNVDSLVEEIKSNHPGEKFLIMDRETKHDFIIKFIFFYEGEERYP